MTKLTRRKFLQAGAVTLVAGAGRWAVADASIRLVGQASAGASLFPAPHIIRYDSHCFTIHDRDEFLFSASFHYSRCPEPLWRDRLTKLQRAGFNTIETYVFWNYHEPVEGQADLSELERFIDLIGEMGFWVIARPGPYVCAEWDAGGFPHWEIAKQFGLRSDSAGSVDSSKHWYDLVLPVIAPRQITRGGPVILMQIENEYDYLKLPDAQKLGYLTSLAETAWKAGIDIPLITCRTAQARKDENDAMVRVADFSNFYPRWNIVKEVVPGLEQLRSEQPAVPLGVTELQGGWFGKFGGKMPADQTGIGPTQINMLSKTVIEQGATFFNYYMGFGGTNFDWAGKGLTTSYDYDAPLAEPGGLREKYYAVRGVGQSLELLGPALVRSEAVDGAVESTSKAVSATLRKDARNRGRSGVLLLRENGNADQLFRLHMADPVAPSRRIAIPRRGSLLLGAREMKACPVGLAISGGELRYSTAEILAHGVSGRPWVILYDEANRAVEISLAADRSPQITGQMSYHAWQRASRAEVIGMRTAEDPRMVLFNRELQVILLARETALRTWVARQPGPTADGESTGKRLSIPWISDAALLSGSEVRGDGAWADLAFLAGDHHVTALVPRRPSRALVDGAPAKVSYIAAWRTARVDVTVPRPPAPAVEIRNVETWVERFDPAVGEWTSAELDPLEKTGPIPYGYVKYRREFTSGGQGKLVVTAFCDDARQVFVNGKRLSTISQPDKKSEFDLIGAAKPGTNLLEISYELFGNPNIGATLGELKGIASAALEEDSGTTPLTGPWQIQRVPAAMHGRAIDPDFSPGTWMKAALGPTGDESEPVPAFTWCRASFTLAEPPAKWQIPWKVTLDAHREALLYLNGKFVGRYATVGPQSDFYLPEPYLRFGSGQANILTVLLAYAEDARAIRTLRLSPYTEYALCRSKIEFQW